MATVERAVALAHQQQVKVILNPAPAQVLSAELLERIELITPNETEAQLLTGVEVVDLDSARRAATILREKGIPVVIITMGSQGAYVQSDALDELVPGIKVTPVDTTGAGDTFNGALTVALAEGMTLKEAIRFANMAASVSVTRMGAQSSAPNRNEIKMISQHRNHIPSREMTLESTSIVGRSLRESAITMTQTAGIRIML